MDIWGKCAVSSWMPWGVGGWGGGRVKWGDVGCGEEGRFRDQGSGGGVGRVQEGLGFLL